MTYKLLLSALLVLNFLADGVAQSKENPNYFCSGDYDMMRVASDSISKNFSIAVDFEEGKVGCAMLLSGKLVKDVNGKFPLRAYLYGSENDPMVGTLVFDPVKKTIRIQVKGAGACQNLIDFGGGETFPLDKKFNYQRFGMVKSDKAVAYSDTLSQGHKKGYLIEGDFVSIIVEGKYFCYVQYTKRPSFKAWIKKSDLQL